jgi:hypothetical protein
MENEPHSQGEHDTPQLLPGGDAHEAGEAARVQTLGIEFGRLSLIPPEGSSWSEWVTTRGIEEAERENRPIDDRSAHYIAAFLGNTANPALRNLATTGAVDGPGIQEELVAHFFRQTDQVRSWIDRLAEYCMYREDRRPVENWRLEIDRQDRADAERLRRERIVATIDDLFQVVPAIQRVGNAGKPGWHGLVSHEGRPGRWIISEGESGVRRVWETDSAQELEDAFVRIVYAQRDWIVETFGGAPRAGEQGTGVS